MPPQYLSKCPPPPPSKKIVFLRGFFARRAIGSYFFQNQHRFSIFFSLKPSTAHGRLLKFFITIVLEIFVFCCHFPPLSYQRLWRVVFFAVLIVLSEKVNQAFSCCFVIYIWVATKFLVLSCAFRLKPQTACEPKLILYLCLDAPLPSDFIKMPPPEKPDFYTVFAIRAYAFDFFFKISHIFPFFCLKLSPPPPTLFNFFTIFSCPFFFRKKTTQESNFNSRWRFVANFFHSVESIVAASFWFLKSFKNLKFDIILKLLDRYTFSRFFNHKTETELQEKLFF